MTDVGADESPLIHREAAASRAAQSPADTTRFYARRQARNLLRNFREATGRDVETVSELADWISRNIR
jgi:hypothetical protein